MPFLCFAPDASTSTSTHTATTVPGTTTTTTNIKSATTNSGTQTNKQDDEPTFDDFKKTIKECANTTDDSAEAFKQIDEILEDESYTDYYINNNDTKGTSKIILHQDPQDPETDLVFDLDKEQTDTFKQTTAFKKRKRNGKNTKKQSHSYGPYEDEKVLKKAPKKNIKKKPIIKKGSLRRETQPHFRNNYNPYYGHPPTTNTARPLQKKTGFATQPKAQQVKPATLEEIKAQQAHNTTRITGPGRTTTPDPVYSKKIITLEKKCFKHHRKTERKKCLKKVKKLKIEEKEQRHTPKALEPTNWWESFKNFWKELW